MKKTNRIPILIASLISLVAILAGTLGSPHTGLAVFNEDITVNGTISSPLIISNKEVIEGKGAMHLIDLNQWGFYPNGEQRIPGSVATPMGSPITVDLPYPGRILVKGSMAFTYTSGAGAAVGGLLYIDGKQAGMYCYIPYDFTMINAPYAKRFVPCTMGNFPTEKPLSAGKHTLQLYIFVNEGPRSVIMFNAGGEGDGFRNLEIYGYDYSTS